jgi:membrane-bound inhibitor of C-type lysozyme
VTTVPRGLLGVVVGVLLAGGGCHRTREFAFVCKDSTTVLVTYSGDSAKLRLSTGDVTLPHAISASGARYANDTLEFWEHQGEARLSRRDTLLHDGCKPPSS